MAENFGLVMGVSDYNGIGPLAGPKTDIQKMEEWLRDEEGGNVNKENYKRFESIEDLSCPLQPQIDQWIGDVYKRLSESGVRGGRFYFYFSGHGLGINWDETAMLLPPWHSFLRSAALSSSKYLDKLVSDGMFEEVFFFLDCCNNRLPGTSGLPPTFGLAKPSSSPARKLTFYASEFDAPAYEAATLDPDKPDNSLTRGLFTDVLLMGLKGGAAGSDGRIRVTDLVRFVEQELPEYATTKNKRQIPRPVNSIASNAFMCSKQFPKRLPVTITFSTPGVKVIIEDADAEPVAEIDSNIGVWSGVLKRGNYWLRKEGDGQGTRISVNGLQTEFKYA